MGSLELKLLKIQCTLGVNGLLLVMKFCGRFNELAHVNEGLEHCIELLTVSCCTSDVGNNRIFFSELTHL